MHDITNIFASIIPLDPKLLVSQLQMIGVAYVRDVKVLNLGKFANLRLSRICTSSTLTLSSLNCSGLLVLEMFKGVLTTMIPNSTNLAQTSAMRISSIKISLGSALQETICLRVCIMTRTKLRVALVNT